MAKRPPSLIYSVDEKPPAWTAILLGLQHVFVISVGWILPVVIVQASGLAGFLVRSYADRIQSSVAGDSCRVQLHFDH